MKKLLITIFALLLVGCSIHYDIYRNLTNNFGRLCQGSSIRANITETDTTATFTATCTKKPQ